MNLKFFKLLVRSGYIALAFGCLNLNALLLQSNNIPSCHSDALHTICFCVTRDAGGILKSSLLKQIKTAFNISTFVETGTYLGLTTSRAAEIFEDVHTIELSRDLYLRAREMFAGRQNVSVHHGDSGELLVDLLPSIHFPILFYLDGHYSEGETAKGSQNTPILSELAAIAGAGKSGAVILIDDIRLFQDSCYPEKIRHTSLDGYPYMDQLVDAILEINPRYQICFLGDALLAFPGDPRVSVSATVSACALHRLSFLWRDFSTKDLEKADLTIAKAQGDEREEIIAYYRLWAPFELQYGFRSFATLWYGLVLREFGQEEQALALFQQAAKNSLPNWRIQAMLTAWAF